MIVIHPNWVSLRYWLGVLKRIETLDAATNKQRGKEQ